MVNTFVTAGYSTNKVPSILQETQETQNEKIGYRLSAANLDKSRLWKQVLEAIQILNLVKSYHILGEIFKSPCPKNPYLIKAWSQEILKKYKKLEYYVFYHQGEYVWIEKSPKLLKVRYDQNYKILEDGSILFQGKKYPKYGLYLPGDLYLTMGFASHPIVIMWMNHIESLKLYINCHIDEFLERGGKKETEMLKYKIDYSKLEHPIWSSDPEFHRNHKAALITKEIVRNEKPWYINKPDFQSAYDYYSQESVKGSLTKTKTTSSFEYYIWVFTQDLNNPRYKL